MHEDSYSTYIMASRSHTLYIGVTGDLQKLGQQVKDAAHAVGSAQRASEDAAVNRAMDNLSRLRDQLAGLGQSGQQGGQPGQGGQAGGRQGGGQPQAGQNGGRQAGVIAMATGLAAGTPAIRASPVRPRRPNKVPTRPIPSATSTRDWTFSTRFAPWCRTVPKRSSSCNP